MSASRRPAPPLALLLLVPASLFGCAHKPETPPATMPGLEAYGDGKEFTCGEKPIHIDVMLGGYLQLHVKDFAPGQVTATWTADRKHLVTKHPGEASPYDISEHGPGENKGTWKHPQGLIPYDYQWDFQGGGELHLTLDVQAPAAGTCRFYATHVRPATPAATPAK